MDDLGFTLSVTPEKVRRLASELSKDYYFGTAESEAFLRVFRLRLIAYLEEELKKFIKERLTI